MTRLLSSQHQQLKNLILLGKETMKKTKRKMLTVCLLLGAALMTESTFATGNISLQTFTITRTGGDCLEIGTWDSTTNTCTMNTLVSFGCIIIVDDNITFDGNGFSILGAGSGTAIEAKGTSIDHLENVVIKNLHMHDFKVGINVGFGDNITIDNNVVNNNRSWGMLIHDSIGTTITANDLDNNGFGDTSGSTQGSGIRLDRTTDSIIDGNTIAGSHAFAILVKDNSNGNTISNNAASYGGGRGIGLMSASNGNTISENIVDSNRAGIVVSSDNVLPHLGPATDNVISRNQTNQNGYAGIAIGGSAGNSVDENTANDNGSYGILVQYSDNNIIEDNTTKGNGLFGLKLQDTSENTVSGNVTGGNYVGFFDDNDTSNNYNINTCTDGSRPAGLCSFEVAVTSVSELESAFANSTAGTTIRLRAGTYQMRSALYSRSSGQSGLPITVVADSGAEILSNGVYPAVFNIRHPHYSFQNINITVQGGTAHAYKADGASPGEFSTAGSNLTISGGICLIDQGESCVKATSSGSGPYADNGLIEKLEIRFTAPTNFGVAEGIDAIGVSDWVIRQNRFYNIQHANFPNTVAWGILIKGHSLNTVVENNFFSNCDVAISLGGVTGSNYMRNLDSSSEHVNGTIQNNLITGSRDVAIFLERARENKIYHNTVINSFTSCGEFCSSIDVRYPESTADIRNNILDKPVNNRDGGSHTASSNVFGNYLTDFLNLDEFDGRINLDSTLFDLTYNRAENLGVNLDYNFNSRPMNGAYDIGAIEYQEPITDPIPTAPYETPTGPDLPLTQDSDHSLNGFYFGTIDAADFDEDGDLDLIVAGHFDAALTPDKSFWMDAEIRVYENLANEFVPGAAIQFRQRQIAALNNIIAFGSIVAKVGDFNQDGKADFVISPSGGNVLSFHNTGNFEFTTHDTGIDYGLMRSHLIEVLDMEQDGQDEIIFTNDQATGLWYKFNLATGSWEARQTDFGHSIDYGPGLTVGDLTGDGYPEFYISGNPQRDNSGIGNLDCGMEPGELTVGQIHQNNGGTGFYFDPLMINGEGFGWGPFVGQQESYDPTQQYDCYGSDNAGGLIVDIDNDGRNDLILAGSHTSFNNNSIAPFLPGTGSHYDLAVLYNDGLDVNGALNMTYWERIGKLDSNNYGNGGAGNVAQPNIAAGDIDGDGYKEIFIQGHHRDSNCEYYDTNCSAYYTFKSLIMGNYGTNDPNSNGAGRTFYNANDLENVGEGGQIIADFNMDGKDDLIYGGATLPFHTNGENGTDNNDASTLRIFVYRNIR